MFGRDVTRTNPKGRKRIDNVRRDKRNYSNSADRIHVVNSAVTPAMSQRGGIRL